MTLAADILKEAVIDYCVQMGSDPMLVQGAGGNVSWKDGDTLWVKASGTWLADARKKEIFVPVDLIALRTEIQAGNFAVAPMVKSASQLRPSIETLLHALMPHRVVVHVHAIEPLVHLVRSNPELEISQKLKTDAFWKIVRYQKPGEALAKAVAEVIRDSPGVNVLLLQNHGVVVGGADIAEVNYILTQLVSKLDARPNSFASDNVRPEAIIIGDNQKYIPVDLPGIHSLAIDPYLFGRIKSDWALYPDHVVFLGHSSVCYDSAQLLKRDLSQNNLSELIFLRGRGVFATPGFSAAKQAQLKCYLDVIVRQPQHTHLNVLNEHQVAELLNWDAERYRQTMSASKQ